MKTQARHPLFAVGLTAALVLGGCGGDGPEEVARAYFEARYACGEEAAGRTYDLVTGVRGGQSRDAFVRDVVAEERAEGCRPERVPEIETFEVSQEGEQAVVEVRLRNAPDGERGGRVRLLETDDGWKVDTGAGGG